MMPGDMSLGACAQEQELLLAGRALWCIEEKKTAFDLSAVWVAIIICSPNLPLLSGEFSSILIRIKACDWIFMNGLPVDISDSRISIHSEQTSVAQGCKI